MTRTISLPRHWSASVIFNRIGNFFQASSAINCPHLIPFFVTPVLLEFLQLKYQGAHKSPNETHPISMCIATSSFFGYCLAHGAHLRFSSGPFSTTCINIVGFCTWVLGQLSVASLAAVLSPNSIAFVPYMLYLALALGELIYHVIHYRDRGEQLRDWLLQTRLVRQLLMLWRQVMPQGDVDQTGMTLPI